MMTNESLGTAGAVEGWRGPSRRMVPGAASWAFSQVPSQRLPGQTFTRNSQSIHHLLNTPTAFPGRWLQNFLCVWVVSPQSLSKFYPGGFPGGTVNRHLPANARDMGLIPGPGGFLMPWNNEAHGPQLLSPRAASTKARVPRACALPQEKPPLWEALRHSEERPPLAQREEAMPGNEDPAQLLISKLLLFYNSPWYPLLCCVTQLPPTLCDPMDCSPPGSSVHGVLQARILQWVAMPSSQGSSQPRDQTQSPTLQADSLPSEPPGKAWQYCPSLNVPLWGDGHIPSFKPAPCSGCPQKSFPIMEFLYSSFFYFFYLLSLNLSTRSHLSKFPKPWSVFYLTLRAQGHFVAGCRQWTLDRWIKSSTFCLKQEQTWIWLFFLMSLNTPRIRSHWCSLLSNTKFLRTETSLGSGKCVLTEGNWHLDGRKCFLDERWSSVVQCEALQLSQGFYTFNKLLNSKLIPRRNRVWRDHSKGIFGFLQIMCTCYREEKEMRQTTVTSDAKSKYVRCCWPSMLQILRDCLEWLMVLSEMSACGKFTSDLCS